MKQEWLYLPICLLQVTCPVTASAGTWCQMKTLQFSWTGWSCTRRWINRWPTTSSAPPTTPTWQAASLEGSPRWRCTDRCCCLDAGTVYTCHSLLGCGGTKPQIMTLFYRFCCIVASYYVLCAVCQMCGTGLLGWQRRRPGTHHHSRQGHVHRHPVQGDHTHTKVLLFTVFNPILSCRFIENESNVHNKVYLGCRRGLSATLCWQCDIAGTKTSSVLSSASSFFFISYYEVVMLYLLPSSNRMSSKPSRRQRSSRRTILLFCPSKTTAGA